MRICHCHINWGSHLIPITDAHGPHNVTNSDTIDNNADDYNANNNRNDITQN